MPHQDERDENTRTHVVLSKGTMVAHYRIVEQIGAGGMGEVYLAEDTKLNRQVALKFLPSHLTTVKEVRTRFVREAQTVAKLNHPNIVSIYDVSEFHERPFYVMELIEGESLHHFAHEKPLPFDMIIEYAIQICQGLAEAHRAGIVHRDIKCANIAVDKQGRIRLLDFGLAAFKGDEKITKTGSTLGTVSYMSPEQVSGRDFDHRSDLFSLGIVLYELIAGRTPFRRDSEGATLKAIVEDNPEPLTRYKSDVPDKLQEIVSELLEKDKEIRYQSAEGVIADLKRLVYDSQQSGFSRTSRVKSRKKKGIVVGLVAGLVVIAAGVGYLVLRPDKTSVSKDDKVPIIAVLPFDNLGQAEDDYFTDGMTEEITSRLASIDGLGVISRSSAIKLKASNELLQELGREHGIDYVLEGTVRWSKQNQNPIVRITPQLIRVSDDRQLWSDNYERELLGVFAVQADIAEKIVNELGLTLTDSDRRQLNVRPTENADAYRLYLRALNKVRRGELGASHPLYDIDSAVALDPNFALAHALRSEIYTGYAFGSPDWMDAGTALAAAHRALELQPNLPEAYLALGKYYNEVETDYERALEEFAMAQSEIHNNPELFDEIAYVQMRQGNFEEAISNRRRAMELDPLNPDRYVKYANFLSFARRNKEAMEVINQAIGFEPNRPQSYWMKITLISKATGDLSRVRAVIDEALKHCDSTELLMHLRYLRGNYPDIPWDDLEKRKILEVRDTTTTDAEFWERMYWFTQYSANRDLWSAYADSSRKTVEKGYNKKHENPDVVAAHGRLLAVLGECDKAVELGRKGKEMMSVDKCHY